jgi:hypothetical protein
MGPIGHCAIAMAAKPLAPRVPVGILLIATLLLDILAIVFMFVRIEGGEKVGNPWSHGLLMSLIWSVFAAFLAGAMELIPRRTPSDETTVRVAAL